ncbi:S-adenosyl-l-methionine hydroxide adenosyltransferase family protein [Chitinophagaceae bacterium LWZ2-11]
MPIVTLTTDIGPQDYLAGAIKGQLLSLNNTFNIVDITHYLSQANYPQAAYICSNAFKYYPSDTFHIIILDLYANPIQHVLLARHKGQFIICPDNGILTMIAGERPQEIVALPVGSKQTLLAITQLIAEAVNHISNGGDLFSVGSILTSIDEKYPLRATIGNNWMEGQILFIDNFENVVINITREEFEEHRKGRSFKILFKRDETIDTISSEYATVYEGEKLAWFNSAGYLEIAVNKGNMAGLFGLQGFNEKMQRQAPALLNKWFYQTVRIFFE